MKNILLLLFLGLIVACKKSDSNAISDLSDKASEANVPKITDQNELTTRLFQNYIPNPIVLGHHEENTIIDYAIEYNLDLQRSQSGLYYMVTKNGTGESLDRLETLSVDYKGSFLDGQTFDSSYDRGIPIKFKIGQMMAGWNEGLRYLKHGDEAIFIIPSRLGYGKKGFPGYVPADKILRFDIKVH